MDIIKKYKVQILMLILLIVVCVCWVTSTILAERAITLARVRQVDFEIIAELLAANDTPGVEGLSAENITEAFNQLKGGADLRSLRVGLLLERNGEVLASNIGDRSVAGVTEELSLGLEAVETRALGNDTILTAIFPDRNYPFYVGNGGFGPTPWHWEISVPFQQLMDGRLDLGVVFPKAGTAIRIMLSSILLFLFLWLTWEYRQDRKSRKLEQDLQASRTKEKNCQRNARDYKQRLQQTEEQSAKDKKEMTDEFYRYIHEEEEWKEKIKNLERKIEDISQGSLFLSKQSTQKLLDIIYHDLQWHNEAKKEALYFLQTGQPAEKKHLSRWLSQLNKDKRMPEDWTPHKTLPEVWHKRGHERTKLYCSNINNNLAVIAVASGKSDHLKLNDGVTLRKRYNSMKMKPN